MTAIMSFAALAALKAVAQMVDTKTLDVMRVLDVDMKTLDRLVEMRILDSQEFVTNLGMWTKGDVRISSR
jgi:hypothetical protein